jgi:hypothetical protein
MRSGGHAQNFKYLPIIQGSEDNHFPRIIKIAGIYPHLSPEDLLAPTSNPAAPIGSWAYDFSEADGPQLGTVALPGSEVITDCLDPVVVISKSTDLGVNLVDEVEMLVVIDRLDTEFKTDKFYIFKTPSNKLIIQWADIVQPGYEILGKVILCTAPFSKSMKAVKSGFLEDDD